MSMLHAWNLSLADAKKTQSELASLVVKEDRFGKIQTVAGVDMAINETTGKARGAVVLLSYPELIELEKHSYEEPLRMPYIPGLLSFREMPALLGAIEMLS